MLKYDLDKLGWSDFESLAQVLLSARIGLGVEGWGGSGDWGRDAYYSSTLRYPQNETCNGPFLFQCKFVSGANSAGARPDAGVLKAIKAEAERISERISKKRSGWDSKPAHYSFLTNAVLGGRIREKATLLLKTILPCTEIHIHDGTDICNWLIITPEAVKGFPQLFSLRELIEHLRETQSALSARSETAVSMAREESRVFVPTKAYFEAWVKLQSFSFVILEGPPEVGKTAIGRMIALAQINQGWEAIECRHPKDFEEAYRSDLPQVFVADDFFGRTDYEPSRVSFWQDELPYILRKLDHQHWLILTSRAHLLKMGKSNLDVSGCNHKFPDPGEVIVNTGKLSREEKARILYRQAKNVSLSEKLKKQLKMHLEEIIDHKHFTPLRIHNLVNSLAKNES